MLYYEEMIDYSMNKYVTARICGEKNSYNKYAFMWVYYSTLKYFP